VIAAWLNSFLKRSNEPNSESMALAKSPCGLGVVRAAGARFSQNRECSRWPAALNENALHRALISPSMPSLRFLSSVSSMALAALT
jgi:hypothetical protein